MSLYRKYIQAVLGLFVFPNNFMAFTAINYDSEKPENLRFETRSFSETLNSFFVYLRLSGLHYKNLVLHMKSRFKLEF